MKRQNRSVPEIQAYVNVTVLKQCEDDLEVLRFELMNESKFIKEITFIHSYSEGNRMINFMVSTKNAIIEIMGIMEDLQNPDVTLKFIGKKRLIIP
jgi:hypothetical protein